MTSEEANKYLAQLEARLTRIENHLNFRPVGAPPPPPNPTPRPTAAPLPSQASVRQTVNIPPPATEPAKPGNWLGIAAVICFVVAAGFIVKLSLETGWLTPVRQIGLAVLFGLSLIFGGGLLARSDREYASFLPAAGVIVLYLTTFAAHGLYQLIPFDVALGLVSLISGLCIWLYVSFRHDVYSITAAAGAYLSPAVLGLNADSDFALYYFLLCSVAFGTISLWIRTRTLTLVAAYLALFMTAAIGLQLKQDTLIAVVMALHFVIFALSTLLYSLHSKTAMTEPESWAFLPVLFAFYGLEYYFIDRLVPGLAPFISLGFAAFLIGLYLLARKTLPDDLASQALVLTFATVVAFHSIYIELLPEEARPWLLVAILLIVAFSPVTRALPKPLGVYVLPLGAIGLIVINEYVTLLYKLLSGEDTYLLIVAFAAFASLWALILRRNALRAEGETTPASVWGYGLLGTAHLLAIMAFYRLAADAGSLAVSVCWLLYATAVIVFAFTRKDEVMAKSALTVLALAAGKALLYDAASAPTVVRIVCLILTGGVLYGCGLLMRRIAVWKT